MTPNKMNRKYSIQFLFYIIKLDDLKSETLNEENFIEKIFLFIL